MPSACLFGKGIGRHPKQQEETAQCTQYASPSTGVFFIICLVYPMLLRSAIRTQQHPHSGSSTLVQQLGAQGTRYFPFSFAKEVKTTRLMGDGQGGFACRVCLHVGGSLAGGQGLRYHCCVGLSVRAAGLTLATGTITIHTA